MLFSSPIFIFGFLPLLFICYFISSRKYKNFILLIFSLVFYAWGEPMYVLIMLLSICINYVMAIFIKSDAAQKSLLFKRALLVLAVCANLALLLYYKYANFFIDNINSILYLMRYSGFATLDVIMPIGISFFTFQGMSYVIDVYWDKVGVQRNFMNLALFVSFFPQLIAGPIVRYIDIEKEINNRRESLSMAAEGIRRFIIGFGKKVIIANTVAKIADSIFGLDIANISSPVAWVGIICYTLQIYFDFSGYSDMAIGLGKIFGFKFLENFDYPYISKSITEFWRRWHISLSTWFRDYVYIPLGGNRKGVARTYINLSLVFLITGFWHGASWNFIVWGLYHGLFLIIEKTKVIDKLLALTHVDRFKKSINILSHVFTLLFVMIGWVFFRSDTLSYAKQYLLRMFALTDPQQVLYSVGYYLNAYTLVIIFVAIVFCTPVYKAFLNKKFISPLQNSTAGAIRDISLVAVFIIAAMSLASSAYNPFIYFRF